VPIACANGTLRVPWPVSFFQSLALAAVWLNYTELVE
jgi:hypothetical protein